MKGLLSSGSRMLLPALLVLASCGGDPVRDEQAETSPNVDAPEGSADAVESSDDEADGAGNEDLSAAAENGEELPFCERVQERVAPWRCEYFEEAWESLQRGVGGVDHPARMQRGETATVTLVLGRPDPGTDIMPDEQLSNMLGKEPDETFKVKVGRRMAAQLHGDGFDIKPSGLVQKDLFIGQGQKWEWKITALKNPKHDLSLSTYAVIAAPDGMKENLLRTIKVDIPVNVTWQQRIEDTTVDLSLLEKFALGLAAFITAAGAIWLAVKSLRPKPPTSATGPVES